jgi:hypothetical protein
MHSQIDAAASDRNPSRMLGNPMSDLFELPFLRKGMRSRDNKYSTRSLIQKTISIVLVPSPNNTYRDLCACERREEVFSAVAFSFTRGGRLLILGMPQSERERILHTRTRRQMHKHTHKTRPAARERKQKELEGCRPCRSAAASCLPIAVAGTDLKT